jgi:protein-tyrosine phosphatase
VCTGNVCRSPFAERVLAHELDRRGIPAHVSSAGLVADGLVIAPQIVELLDRVGIDGRAHVSRLIGAEILAGADLVLGMAREHVREAVLLAPDRFGRVFTLKELVRRGRAVGPRSHGEDLAAWLDRVGAGRRPTDTLGSSPDDDVVDPIGQRQSVFQRVADEINEQVAALVELAWPQAPTRFAPASRPAVP